MKKIIVLSVFLAATLLSFAQSKRYYCEIMGIERELTAKLKIVFDFGHNPIYSAWGTLKGDQKLVDEKGEEIPFNSMVDAGNYMASKGWNFLQAYASSYSEKSVTHWIFYKEAESPEEAIQGIMTKDSYKKMKEKSKDN